MRSSPYTATTGLRPPLTARLSLTTTTTTPHWYCNDVKHNYSKENNYMALLTPNHLTTSTNPSTIGVLVTPEPNVLEHLKRLFFLDFHRDPTFLKE